MPRISKEGGAAPRMTTNNSAATRDILLTPRQQQADNYIIPRLKLKEDFPKVQFLFDLQTGHRAGLEIAYPDGMVVRVGDEQLVAPAGHAVGFVEPRLRPVLQSLLPVAEERLHRARLRIHGLDLVVVAVGHIEHALVPSQADAVLEQRVVPHAVLVAEVEESGAHDRPDLPGGIEVHLADRADLAVGDVYLAVLDGQAARLGEQRLVVRPVGDVFAPGAAEGA